MLTSGRKKSVQDAPTANDHDCTDAKPTKRSFKGKGDSAFRGIVRFWEGWCGAKGGGEAIPPVVAQFFGRQHLTFDKGGKDIVLFEGIVCNNNDI